MKKSIIKRLVYTLSNFSPRFIYKVNLSNTKNSTRFLYFGLPFWQRGATCKLAATEDYRIFRGCPTNWLGRLWINLLIFGGRLGYFVWEEYWFSRPNLLWSNMTDIFGSTYKTINLMRNLFDSWTVKLFFSKITLIAFASKGTWMCLKVNWFVDYKYIVWFKLWIYQRELRF